ncbi:hypothetical protein F0169_15945 [Pseudomonas sp. MAFF 212408]|uniref:KTSC domain-containing protein n=1 Tax=Pseudomonas kitaguniensis TaxID=2607908 RepID=A0A5N7KP98_9PSED|nr:hypothetical protein [Pseudomonas kitaguniensis]
MQQYKNLSGDSNVLGYELGVDTITVQFATGTHRNYVYDETAPGAAIVTELSRLAIAGRGLNSYIVRTVKKNYARKY